MTPSARECLERFCRVVLSHCGDQQASVQQEVQLFLDQPWPVDGDAAVQEYMTAVPNHIFACKDLDYQRFSTSPLVVPRALSLSLTSETLLHGRT